MRLGLTIQGFGQEGVGANSRTRFSKAACGISRFTVEEVDIAEVAA